MPKKNPGYDYENKGDRKVTLRLDQQYGHFYTLQFTTSDPDDRDPILRPSWYAVRTYVPTPSRLHKPGDGCPEKLYGNWVHYTVYVENPEAGKQMLQKLREAIHTVRDIYRTFIEDGIRQMESDRERYEEYRKTVEKLPERIE